MSIKSKARTALKRALVGTPGALDVAWWRASRAGQEYGIDVIKKRETVDLYKDRHAIRIRPQQVMRAAYIFKHFDQYRHMLPTSDEEHVEVTDFTENPAVIEWGRRCLELGVSIESRDGVVWLRKDRRVMILGVRHFIYCESMAERFDLYFDCLVPREQDGLLFLDYSQPGTLQRYAGSGLEFEMASFPEEEEALEEYFKWYRPKPGDLVFDMGAHCGVSTYKLSKLVGSAGRVIAFEPDPVNYGILLRNIRRHGLENVTAVNAAIAGQQGRLPFSSEGTIGSSLMSVMLRESVGSTVMVDAVTMEDAFKRWGAPSFCKIDIEGAEIEVLEAAREVLTTHATQLAIDTNHPLANGELTDSRVEAILREYRYEVFSEAKPLMTTWARPSEA